MEIMKKRLLKLAEAIESNDLATIDRLLAKRGLNVDDYLDGVATPLIFAVGANNIALVNKLIAMGVNINKGTAAGDGDSQYIQGLTPLMCAIRKHHIEIAKLLTSEPDIDLYAETTDRSRGTSLFYAIAHKQYDAFAALLDAGLDIHRKDPASNRDYFAVNTTCEFYARWLAEKLESTISQSGYTPPSIEF